MLGVDLVDRVRQASGAVDSTEFQPDFPGLGLRTWRVNARRVGGPRRRGSLILWALEDVTPHRPDHGYGQPEDERRAFAAGFDHHFRKPIGIREQETLLREHCAKLQRSEFTA